ncbi:DUF3054 domain-containing protein [Pseudonocardia asaccharolytica]|uniref:Membrane protein n=1 Tax=Pseudonocardia asaccharolytica DSM 44247 = NBRC 16224 TaxID=1123024 RepID=A0A511CZB1_9PSEU|nr:DUF3054 domain-containing protein [Pseudonocardia asaccharolytica]GEL17807.1 membrane protein [Pseudonocardia asaccharolytica DSM 44247 = NBRC 16224]
MVHGQHSRIPALALVADAVAVVVFAALGRLSHDEPGDLVGLLGTAAPFLVGLAAAWATPWVRARPLDLRSGGLALAGTAVLGLLLRAAFTGRLPASFAIVASVSLAVLFLGWRAIALLVSRRRDREMR